MVPIRWLTYPVRVFESSVESVGESVDSEQKGLCDGRLPVISDPHHRDHHERRALSRGMSLTQASSDPYTTR